MSECDRLRVKKICEIGERLLGKDSDGYCKDPRSFPAEVRAEILRAAKQLGPLLKRMTDETDRAEARAKAEREGT